MYDYPYLQRCPIGNHFSLRPSHIHLPEGALLQCEECGQLISQATTKRYRDSMQEFNTPQGTLPAEKAQRRSFKRHRYFLKIVRGLLRKNPAEINLLDVGCSSGAFLLSARTLGYSVAGVEPAQRAAETARSFGLTIHSGVLQETALPLASQDVITLFEVIEHLKDPISLLQTCHGILKPSGLMCIGTGNTDSWTVQRLKNRWEYFDIEQHGGHISFFNPYSMKALASQTGFEIITLKTRRVSFTEPGEASLKNKRLKIIAELLNLPARLCNKGHDMLVILKKRSI